MLKESRIAALLVVFTFSATFAFGDGLGITKSNQISTLEGFKAELLYEVPSDKQGSWVSLTVDPKGRLVACDQYGGLYRIDVSGSETKVEKLSIDFTGAQGLLCAFGSLYANVNHRGDISGVWKLTDTNGDDQYDKKEHILPLNGGSEHGPHAMILTPDGKRIIMCAGNNTNLPTVDRSRVPQNWKEDHLLGRMPDARGHNARRMAPGGFVLSMNADGKDIELIATGFRNQYDIALNKDGELFAYDADMEWDVGTPWYRPTRVNHVISGAEFGWRNGTGKWPAYYPDSFGAAVNIGPGSPTGICFGYGANFPAKYQNALFICDWSYGNIHAVHLTEDGSSYAGSFETFATASPLPVTDIVVHPDGMLYFTIGGRRTQSGLYRIRWTGAKEDAVAAKGDKQAKRLRQKRKTLEDMHLSSPSSDVVDAALASLGDADRGVRFAARIALEKQPVANWRDKVLGVTNDHAKIIAAVALARNGKKSDKAPLLKMLNSISWTDLNSSQRLDLLRAYSLIGIRIGPITSVESDQIIAQLPRKFPSGDNKVDRELSQMFVYLSDTRGIRRVVAELGKAASQENQIHYAMALRGTQVGWTPELDDAYFSWFNEIQSSARGGMSFGGFINNIRDVAKKRLTRDDMNRLDKILNPPKQAVKQEQPRALVKQWKVDELLDAVSSEDLKPDFTQGREIFVAAQCYKCHRMGVQGGILGPDLTGAGGRYTYKDLLVSIIEPSKVISDQYAAQQFLTEDGRAVTGRIINMKGDDLRIMTNMLDPSDLTVIKRSEVETSRPTTNSMMPANLLDTFTKEEIANLVAYLRAGGNPRHKIYAKSGKK